ncbi:MAG TPA: gamma-glutamylcyclotransferase family protein, partial [Solirubrobacteraceae bacterium]|nr:gamma-glutamylcyclotransferase family protein [Solirubrobacteraceae bacterium]
EGRLFDMGEWPTLVLGGGIVHGELFEVLDVAVFAKLDPFEECDPADPGRSRYTRERVALVEPETEAWVYVANEPVPHDALIESGSWYAWRTRR